MANLEQLMRSFAIAKKDIKIYYLKGPVIIFGILFPIFLFAAFIIGRNIPTSFLISGLLGMTILFTSTSVSPVITPWETQMKTLERLASCPISISTILLGDIFASLIFGIGISLIPLIVGIIIGVSLIHPFILTLGFVLAAFCFSSLGLILSSPPTSMVSNIMMLSTLVKFPLVFISGIFIPIEEMPVWGKIIASFSPLTYFTDIARYSLQGTNYYPISLDLIVLLSFTILFLIAAIKLHERSFPKRL